MKDQLLAGLGGLIVGLALSFIVRGDDMTPKHYLKIKPGLVITDVEVIVGGGYVASAEIKTREVFDAFFEKKSGSMFVNGVDIGTVALKYDPSLINKMAVEDEEAD